MMARPFYVYILKCSDDSYYTGHTDNLERRLFEHQEGLVGCYTQDKRPVTLVYNDVTKYRSDALAFEQKVKKWSRKKKEALIERDWEKVGLYAKKNFD